MTETCLQVRGFFHPATGTVTYVAADPDTHDCAIIDPVLDFDPRAGRVSTASADRVADYVRANGLRPQWLIDTHIHADHLTAQAYLRDMLGGASGIGDGVRTVQRVFADFYSEGEGFRRDGSQFDHLFVDGEIFSVGNIAAEAVTVPGHTPSCVAYHIGDALFTGDALLMPDFGTARCDFPGGDARSLYHSIRRLFALPPQTRVFVGHDYAPNGREAAWETTIGVQMEANIQVHDGVGETEFVDRRTQRDATLDLPELMLAVVQMNMRGGRMPPPSANGVSYLRIPVTRG